MFDDDYLGKYMTECPKCGHRYNKRLHGGKCPDCGHRKGMSKLLPFVVIALILLFFVFRDSYIINRILFAFDIINPVYIVIAINVIIYLMNVDSYQYSNSYYYTILNKQYYRLLTSGFMHADTMHLICNMYSLYNLGTFVYDSLGTILFLVIYFGSMLLGGYISAHMHHYSGNDNVRSVGASGAICGLLGFYIAFIIMMRIPLNQTLRYIYKALLPIVITAFDSNIDNYGHVSGLAVGFVLSMIIIWILI